jgi:site-specific recombinase XerD
MSEFLVSFTVKKDKRLPNPMLYCNISLGGSRKTFSMGIHATHETWDPLKREIAGNEDANKIINKTYRSLYRINSELAQSGEVTLQKIKEVFDGRKSWANKDITIKGVCSGYLNQRIGEGVKHSTVETIKATAKHLTRASQIFYQGAESILDIESDFYPALKLYLSDIGLSKNSINQYLSTAKSILDYAEAIEPRFKNPSKSLRYFKAIREYRHLSDAQVSKIRDRAIKAPPESCESLFMIQVLTGMGYSELKAFRFSENLIWEDNTLAWIKIARKKTGKVCEVPVPLEFWRYAIKKFVKDDKFPVPSLTFYNKKLKEAADELGIDRFTSHYGRHTFATKKINEGWTIESVARMIGDTVTTTERVYADIKSERIKLELKNRNKDGISEIR